jgi:hypothetical protein
VPARTGAPQLAGRNLKDRVASPEHASEMGPLGKGRKVVCGCGTWPDCPPADVEFLQAGETAFLHLARTEERLARCVVSVAIRASRCFRLYARAILWS